MEKKHKNTKLSGLKYMREMLLNENRVIAYSENCDPNPYSFKRHCTWSYGINPYDMGTCPCPWDSKVRSGFKGRVGCGCFERCLLNNKKEEQILQDKEVYIEAIDILISNLETDPSWGRRKSVKCKGILTDEARSRLVATKGRRSKKGKKSRNSPKEIQKQKTSMPELEVMAEEIIDYVKEKDIHVIRYDSETSESIYLKFDYGMAGSLRISSHKSNKKQVGYIFNILKGLSGPYKETAYSSNGVPFNKFYYPEYMYKNVKDDIVRYKEFRQSKYGKLRYKSLVEKNKLKVNEEIGFWSKAKEV